MMVQQQQPVDIRQLGLITAIRDGGQDTSTDTPLTIEQATKEVSNGRDGSGEGLWEPETLMPNGNTAQARDDGCGSR